MCRSIFNKESQKECRIVFSEKVLAVYLWSVPTLIRMETVDLSVGAGVFKDVPALADKAARIGT